MRVTSLFAIIVALLTAIRLSTAPAPVVTDPLDAKLAAATDPDVALKLCLDRVRSGKLAALKPFLLSVKFLDRLDPPDTRDDDETLRIRKLHGSAAEEFPDEAETLMAELLRDKDFCDYYARIAAVQDALAGYDALKPDTLALVDGLIFLPPSAAGSSPYAKRGIQILAKAGGGYGIERVSGAFLRRDVTVHRRLIWVRTVLLPLRNRECALQIYRRLLANNLLEQELYFRLSDALFDDRWVEILRPFGVHEDDAKQNIPRWQDASTEALNMVLAIAKQMRGGRELDARRLQAIQRTEVQVKRILAARVADKEPPPQSDRPAKK